mgnify:CR=1 FL=1
MSSPSTVTRITVIVELLFPMEPPNGVAAVFFGYLSLQVQVTRIVLAMMELVVFSQILHPRFCLFLKVHRPRDRRDLQHVKMPILMHLSCVTPRHLVKHLQVQVSRNVLALVLRPFFFFAKLILYLLFYLFLKVNTPRGTRYLYKIPNLSN